MVLGLVAMATNVDSLYASMKAMVCIVGNSIVALKEMERTGGFQVCVCVWLCYTKLSKSFLTKSNIPYFHNFAVSFSSSSCSVVEHVATF